MSKTFDLKFRSFLSSWCEFKHDKDAAINEAQQICADYSKNNNEDPNKSPHIFPAVYNPAGGNAPFLKSFDPKS